MFIINGVHLSFIVINVSIFLYLPNGDRAINLMAEALGNPYYHYFSSLIMNYISLETLIIALHDSDEEMAI